MDEKELAKYHCKRLAEVYLRNVQSNMAILEMLRHLSAIYEIYIGISSNEITIDGEKVTL